MCPGVVLGLVALVDVLHLPVDLADGVGAQARAGGILLGEFAVGFIPQLVLQTGPHIHGDGAELISTGRTMVPSLMTMGTLTIRCRLR